MLRSFALLTLALLGASTIDAQTLACDALSGRQRKAAQRILDSEHLYDCCDGTIADCLSRQPTCSLAPRLASNVCRRLAAGEDEARIRRALSRRARSMLGGGEQPLMELDGAPVLGEAEAPVEVVVYACARCPYCSRLLPLLHDEIAGGRLAGQARLVFRIFPIRGHEGSTEAGLAFVCAHQQGSFWPFMLHAYRRFEEFSPELQGEWATAAGLDGATFSSCLDSPSSREVLVVSKKEGLANGVEETPTFYFNRRRWVGELDLEELVDAIGEEAERVRGETWVTE